MMELEFPEALKIQIECINDSNTIFEAINGETTDKEKYNLPWTGIKLYCKNHNIRI